MNPISQRQTYTTDNGISPFGLLVLWGGPLLVATGVAWLLKVLWFAGFFIVIVVPALAGFAVAGALRFFVWASHCRNRWLAGGVGAVAGLMAFLGYYYLCLWAAMPAGGPPDPAFLPEFILHRINTDVARDLNRAGPNNNQPTVVMNWFSFVWELGTMTATPAIFAWLQARRAYCPGLKRWFRREVAQFPAYTGEDLLAAIEHDGLSKFVALTPTGGDALTACRFVVESVDPPSGSALNFPVYASIEDLPQPKPWYWPPRQRRTLLRQIELSLDELMTVLPFFPNLAKHLGSRHEELRDISRDVPVDLPPVSAEAVARITPVATQYRQRLSGLGYTIKANLLAVLPLIFIFAALGSVALGVQLLIHHFEWFSLPLFALSVPLFVWGPTRASGAWERTKAAGSIAGCEPKSARVRRPW